MLLIDSVAVSPLNAMIVCFWGRSVSHQTGWGQLRRQKLPPPKRRRDQSVEPDESRSGNNKTNHRPKPAMRTKHSNKRRHNAPTKVLLSFTETT